MPKIIEIHECILLLQAKMKDFAAKFAPPCNVVN